MSLKETLDLLGKIHKKYKTLSARIVKEVTNIDKDGNESVVTISYKIKLIDSARFMASALSNHVDNLTEGIQKIKCRDCDSFLEYESFKANFIKYKCLSINAIKIIQTSSMKN